MLPLSFARSLSHYLCLTHFECLDFYGLCHFCLLCAAVCAAPCPNVYVSHRFVYDAQRQSIFYPLRPPSAFSQPLAHPILKLYFWPFCGNCLLFGSGSGCGNLLLLLLLPPHHFLLTKNSLLGNFSLFILFATLQKCLYPGSEHATNAFHCARHPPSPLSPPHPLQLWLTDCRLLCAFRAFPLSIENVFYAL